MSTLGASRATLQLERRWLLLALSCACGSGVPEGSADAAPAADASTCAQPVSLAQGGMISRLAMDAADVYWLETPRAMLRSSTHAVTGGLPLTFNEAT